MGGLLGGLWGAQWGCEGSTEGLRVLVLGFVGFCSVLGGPGRPWGALGVSEGHGGSGGILGRCAELGGALGGL